MLTFFLLSVFLVTDRQIVKKFKYWKKERLWVNISIKPKKFDIYCTLLYQRIQSVCSIWRHVPNVKVKYAANIWKTVSYHALIRNRKKNLIALNATPEIDTNYLYQMQYLNAIINNIKCDTGNTGMVFFVDKPYTCLDNNSYFNSICLF